MRGFLTANNSEGVCKVSIEYKSPLATSSTENLITRTHDKSFIACQTTREMSNDNHENNWPFASPEADTIPGSCAFLGRTSWNMCMSS